MFDRDYGVVCAPLPIVVNSIVLIEAFRCTAGSPAPLPVATRLFIAGKQRRAQGVRGYGSGAARGTDSRWKRCGTIRSRPV